MGEILSKVQAGPSNTEWASQVDDEGLRGVIEDLSEISTIEAKGGRAIVTLIANVKQSSNVMAVVFQVMSALTVQVEMLSQGASKVNISLVVPGEREKEVIQALHACLVPMGDFAAAYEGETEVVKLGKL